MIKIPKEIQNLNLTVNFIKEGNKVIAYSPALDLSSFGKTEVEAKKRFQEVVNIFFSDIVERKVLGEVLTELGWRKQKVNLKSKWVPPIVRSENISLNLALSK